MTTKLECKIGTGLYIALKNAHKLDGRSHNIVIENAWRRRCRFNNLSKTAGRLWKERMFTPSSSGYEMGVVE